MKYVGDLLINEERSPLIEYFRLGAELPIEEKLSEFEIKDTQLHPNGDIFLSVGTLEPRKGYSICLDAAEIARGKGSDFVYIIVGRYGWSQESIRRRILDHPEYNRRLFWLNNADDEVISSLYKRSRALIYSSIDEGFGLPLIEAAHYGLPAIVSDIAVFREIAGSQATYFEIGNSYKLAEHIIYACDTPKISPRINFINWDQSKSELLEHIEKIIDVQGC